MKKSGLVFGAGVLVLAAGMPAAASVVSVRYSATEMSNEVADLHDADVNGRVEPTTARTMAPTVRDRETVSMSMLASSNATQRPYNEGGHVSVQNDEGWIDLGETLAGAMLQGRWFETSDSQGNPRIVAEWRTLGGSEFLPVGTQMPDGTPVNFAQWQFGLQDALHFRDWVDDVTLEKASARMSFDGGNSFAATLPMTAVVKAMGTWNVTDGGSDPGDPQIFAGSGYNYMQMRYEFTAIPAPATAAILTMVGLVAARRRRS